MRIKFVLGSNSTQLIISFSFLLLFRNFQVEAQTLTLELCSNSPNYTSKSQFQTNLNLLLQSLQSNGTEYGFFNTSTGIDSDTVYGLAQCRGDIPMEECQNCLNTSTVEIKQRCPRRKEATLQYDQCILQYSDHIFFSQVDSNRRWLINPFNVSDADDERFNQQLNDLMNNLSSTAASLSSRYDSGEFKYNSFNTTYVMVQCRRDLSPSGCQSCLQSMISFIPVCCSSKQGARIYSTTCYIRYESYPFVEAGDNFYMNSPFSPPPESSKNTTNTKRGDGTGKGLSTASVIAIIVLPILALVLLLAICAVVMRRRIRKNRTKTKPETLDAKGEVRSEDALQFDLDTIRTATNDFSDANKLGQGGFGVVYKGELVDGQEIAVKRLFKNSGQGSQEFKNEIALLHKLQHRNLVRLLGFCLNEEEQLLIYEFVPNTSLDKYIFDPVKRSLLNWERRYKIIGGVARGLLYLHEDSRLRIIHRDLKSGNILLDEKMDAKISDFGVAKLFGVDQTRGNTSKIAGTYGYMAPEYALHGLFSVKSDVYSFGVLVLEIISGQKTNNFRRGSGPSRDLLSYTWKLWTEGNALQIMDPTLMESYSENEVMKCIHVGLLCLQDNLDKRPTMSSVVLMLNSYSVALETPSAPAFLLETRTGDDDDGTS